MKYIKNKWLILSLIVCSILYIISIYVTANASLFLGLIIFFTIIPIYFINYISEKNSDKYSKKVKSILDIICFTYIVGIQFIFWGCITLLLSFMFAFDIDNVVFYNSALGQIKCKECIRHFPKRIPKNAQNVLFYKGSHPFFGSCEIKLSFDTTKEYIEKELDKFEYKKVEGPFSESEKYNYSVRFLEANEPGILDGNTKNYIIKSNETLSKPTSDPYAFGLLVNQTTNRITYYYIAPD